MQENANVEIFGHSPLPNGLNPDICSHLQVVKFSNLTYSSKFLHTTNIFLKVQYLYCNRLGAGASGHDHGQKGVSINEKSEVRVRPYDFEMYIEIRNRVFFENFF